MRQVEALLLDADGVVQLPAPTWRREMEALCGGASRFDDFLNDLFAAEGPCLTGTEDFRVSLSAVLTRWGSDATVDDTMRIWTRIEADAEVMAIVARLRAGGIPVALATNQQPFRAAFMTTHLGYASHFDHLLYSCDLGYAKPSAQYFHRALQRLSLAPEQVLFIDDHESNVLAARSCGLNAEVFHLSEGAGRISEVLRAYGFSVA